MKWRALGWFQQANNFRLGRKPFSSAVFKKTDLDCKQRRKLFEFFKKVFIENQEQLRVVAFDSNMDYITRLAMNMVLLNIDNKDCYQDLKSKN
jgi:hypothetical protein